MSSWKDIAGKVIAAGAPTLGQMMGDMLPVPFGGSMGRWAGEFLARQLGVSATPEAVATAMDGSSPATISEVMARAEAEAVAKWQALADISKAQAEVGKAQVEAVNETIRAEVAGGDGWLGRWRGVHAWEFTCECPFWGGVLLYSALFQPQSLSALVGASGLILAWWGIRGGIMGVHVWQSSNERQAAISK